MEVDCELTTVIGAAEENRASAVQRDLAVLKIAPPSVAYHQSTVGAEVGQDELLAGVSDFSMVARNHGVVEHQVAIIITAQQEAHEAVVEVDCPPLEFDRKTVGHWLCTPYRANLGDFILLLPVKQFQQRQGAGLAFQLYVTQGAKEAGRDSFRGLSSEQGNDGLPAFCKIAEPGGDIDGITQDFPSRAQDGSGVDSDTHLETGFCPAGDRTRITVNFKGSFESAVRAGKEAEHVVTLGAEDFSAIGFHRAGSRFQGLLNQRSSGRVAQFREQVSTAADIRKHDRNDHFLRTNHCQARFFPRGVSLACSHHDRP